MSGSLSNFIQRGIKGSNVKLRGRKSRSEHVWQMKEQNWGTGTRRGVPADVEKRFNFNTYRLLKQRGRMMTAECDDEEIAGVTLCVCGIKVLTHTGLDQCDKAAATAAVQPGNCRTSFS